MDWAELEGLVAAAIAGTHPFLYKTDVKKDPFEPTSLLTEDDYKSIARTAIRAFHEVQLEDLDARLPG